MLPPTETTGPVWTFGHRASGVTDTDVHFLMSGYSTPTYRNLQLGSVYRRHEKEKKRSYEDRVREVEHGSFTPLVFSTSGGMGTPATTAYKRLASLISCKKNQPYNRVMTWLRCHLCFSLLRSSTTAIRGARSRDGHAARSIPAVDLAVHEGHVQIQNSIPSFL